MGSPFRPSSAITFMCSFEKERILDCSKNVKLVFYRSYVDDIFALFFFPDHANKYQENLSSKHPNLNFSIDNEKNGCLPFFTC